MSTINGFGTLRYDWSYHADGTAEATLWAVAGFLPVIPLKRERIRVQSAGRGGTRSVNIALSMTDYKTAFDAEFQVLDRVPIRWVGVLKTYVCGYVVTPLLLVGVPWFVFWAGQQILDLCGFNWHKFGDYVTVTYVISAIGWVSITVAKILDCCAGRNAPTLY